MAFRNTLCVFAFLCCLSLKDTFAYKDEADSSKGGCRAYMERCQPKLHPCCAGLHCVYQRCRWSAYPEDLRDYTLQSMQRQQRMLEKFLEDQRIRSFSNWTTDVLPFPQQSVDRFRRPHRPNTGGYEPDYARFGSQRNLDNGIFKPSGDYGLGSRPSTVGYPNRGPDYGLTGVLGEGPSRPNIFPRPDVPSGIDFGKVHHWDPYRPVSNSRFWPKSPINGGLEVPRYYREMQKPPGGSGQPTKAVKDEGVPLIPLSAW